MTVIAKEGVYEVCITEQFGSDASYFDGVGMIVSAPGIHSYMEGVEVMLEGGITEETLCVETLLD